MVGENQNKWPVLNYNALKDTITTLQLWAQIIGKIRLKKMPWINHSWHVTLYVSPKGLTTGSIPFEEGNFEIEFDFCDHRLLISTSTGDRETVALYARTVASFYREVFEKLDSAGIKAEIVATPNEINPALPFAEDEFHETYDAGQMHLYWQSLVHINNVFLNFRAGFQGKCSPVHLFWGAFDLAVTRFSGRKAPEYKTAIPNMPLRVMQEAYSHEVCSVGFWPGSDSFPEPAFYAYCYPSPAEFGKYKVEPPEAFFSDEMGEFFLTYQVVSSSENPEVTLMKFLESTYDAAVETAHWDRDALDFKFSRAL